MRSRTPYSDVSGGGGGGIGVAWALELPGQSHFEEHLHYVVGRYRVTDTDTDIYILVTGDTSH